MNAHTSYDALAQVWALNAQLIQRTVELELAGKRKSALLANMTHELRTPLNAIIGFSEIMLDHDVIEIGEAQRQSFLDHIQRSGHDLLNLVNDILELAKVEAGRLELQHENVQLHDLIVGCVDFIRGVSHPKQLTIVSHCEPADAVVSADPGRLKQVLYNLLSNAVKFTPTGGRISVTAEVHRTETVIAVRDNGIGVRPEDQRLIFEPFHQVHDGPPGAYTGTGLGLPLARELVELHGGRMWLDDATEVGSCFRFTLPRR